MIEPIYFTYRMINLVIIENELKLSKYYLSNKRKSYPVSTFAKYCYLITIITYEINYLKKQ